MSSVYTVREINQYIRNMFTQDFFLQKVYVRGEVSNCKYHSSGHIYFSLKDESGVIRCVMFAGDRKGLAFTLENGQQIIVFGGINTYPRDGSYQMYAKGIRLDGIGILYERYAMLRQELQEMGMFAPEYKKPIPKFVKRLGIVTAPTGAAVRDMIQISTRRNPGIQIILYPAKVQGDGAAESIVRGIKTLDRYGVDVIIIGRGGGSIEDLWAFNEEIVARAVFECETPVISAVGHETDTVISDYVADLRAPTPSAAAELAVADMSAFQEAADRLRDRLAAGMRSRLTESRNRTERYELKLRLFAPQRKLDDLRHLADDQRTRMERAMQMHLKDERTTVRVIRERLLGLSPQKKLEQGFAVVTKEDGERILSVAQTESGDMLRIYLRDGYADVSVIRKGSLEEA
ncbi:MAG: exodeoxyribonuclease VII large subunit [Lachnospiraceae bacterium]|nr:exodeoxyribonuclease VII large subunit [Lachnospiraceae bacterium]